MAGHDRFHRFGVVLEPAEERPLVARALQVVGGTVDLVVDIPRQIISEEAQALLVGDEATGEDEFYWKDLIGLAVEDPSGHVIGQVDSLLGTGANGVLVVRAPSGEVLIPFVRHVVTEVDLGSGRIVVDWPRTR